MKVRIRITVEARVRMQKRVSVGLGMPEIKRRGSNVGALLSGTQLSGDSTVRRLNCRVGQVSGGSSVERSTVGG